MIYSVNRRKVGIEVYTAYLGQGAARVDWDLARGKAQRGIIDLDKGDERMLSNVQRGLDEKCLNTYWALTRCGYVSRRMTRRRWSGRWSNWRHQSVFLITDMSGFISVSMRCPAMEEAFAPTRWVDARVR